MKGNAPPIIFLSIFVVITIAFFGKCMVVRNHAGISITQKAGFGITCSYLDIRNWSRIDCWDHAAIRDGILQGDIKETQPMQKIFQDIKKMGLSDEAAKDKISNRMKKPKIKT